MEEYNDTAEKTFSISEVAGTSDAGIRPAIDNALNRARLTLRNLEWFQLGEIRGAIGAEGSSITGDVENRFQARIVRSCPMNDRVEGKIEEFIGKVSGDKTRELEGKVRRKAGEVKDKLEEVKDKVEENFQQGGRPKGGAA